MSALDDLKSVALTAAGEIARHAVRWALDHLASKDVEIPPHVRAELETLLAAELEVLGTVTAGVMKEWEAAEARGRANPMIPPEMIDLVPPPEEP